MPNLYLNFHIATLNKKQRKDDLFVLSDVNKKDAFDILKKTFETHKNLLINSKGKLSYYKVDEKQRLIYGYVEAGEQGFTSKFVDLDSKKLVYNRKKRDLELIPFYFLVSVPKDSKYCFIVVQTLGMSSPYEVISYIVKKGLNSFDATCKFKAVCENDKLIAQTLKDKGEVLRIEAYTAQEPRDKAGDYVSKTYVRQVFSGFSQSFMSKLIHHNSKNSLTDLLAIDEVDNYKLHIKDSKGKVRCLSISSYQATNYDISDIPLNDQGHPKLDEILKVSQDYLENIVELFQ